MAGSQNFGLNIFQWNCNGLSAHRNEFQQHLSNNSYDVICLQDTFLKPSKNLSIDGYSMIRKDRVDMRKGGLVTFIMRPSSIGGGRILRRTLSVCPSVCPSVPLSLPSVTSRHLANYNDTHVLFGTR